MKSKLILTISSIALLTSCQLNDNEIFSDERDNIVNTWSCKETITGGETTTYDVNITRSEEDDGIVYFDNLFQLSSIVDVEMNSFNLTIHEQEVAGWLLSGSGTINGDYTKISLSFSADDGSGEDMQVTAILTE
jgi:hypothetical protein